MTLQAEEVRVKIKPERARFKMPEQKTPGAAGFDVYHIQDEYLEIVPGEIKKIPLGFSMEIPKGFEAQVRSRSGLAAKEGITVLNSPGTIDFDFRGEVCVLLVHQGKHKYLLAPGDRIAQIVIAPVPQVILELTDELSETERAEGGFGSTGR